jgi:hypothetical protein
MNIWNKTADKRPVDNQKIVYYFEPFDQIYVGTYEAESDSVFARGSGFTTIEPEVPCWADLNEFVNSIPSELKDYWKDD